MDVSFNWKPFELNDMDFLFNRIGPAWNVISLTLKGLAQTFNIGHLIIHTNVYSQADVVEPGPKF